MTSLPPRTLLPDRQDWTRRPNDETLRWGGGALDLLEKAESIMMTLPSSYSSASIEPSSPRPRPRRSLRERMRPAFRGIKYGVRGHSRFFVYFFCAALVLTAAVVLRCDLVQWCLLLGCTGMVLITELLNSAVIVLIRALDDEGRARAAPCLDVALGAVLLAVVTAAVIGSFVFVSRLVEMVAPP